MLKLVPEHTVKNREKLVEYLDFCISKHTSKSDIYAEAHHILPKCIFPEFANLKKNPWNKSVLKYEDHYTAHSIIIEAFTSTKLLYGWWLMNTCTGKFKGKHPETIIGTELYSNLKTQYLNENLIRGKLPRKIVIGEDGLTPNQRAAKRRGVEAFRIAGKLGAETAHKNGSYAKREPKRKQTMNTPKANGLTPSQEKGLKISKQKSAIQSNGKSLASNAARKGLENHGTRIIDIFLPSGELFGTACGDLIGYCKSHQIPHKRMQWSYLNNSTPIPGNAKIKDKNCIPGKSYAGWYSREVSREEYLARLEHPKS